MELEEVKECILFVLENNPEECDFGTLFSETKDKCGKNKHCPHQFEVERAITSLIEAGKIKKTKGNMYSLSLE